MRRFSIFMSLVLSGTAALAQENYQQWSSQKTIYLNTQVAGVSGNVLKFPLLVRLGSANASEIFAGSQGGGADIRFSKTNGTHLKYQIERWDSAGKAAEVWVLMDTVPGNGSMSFNMHWGKAGAADSSTQAVFDTSNGFVGAWHLGNAPKANPRPSATPGAPTAILRNYDTVNYAPVAGIIGLTDSLAGGPGDNLMGNTANYIDLNHRGYQGYSDFRTGFTFSTWIYETALVSFERFIELLDDTTSSASSDTRIILFGNKNPPVNGVSVRWGQSGIFNGANDNTYAQDEWYHLVFTKPGGDAPMTIYSNGRQIEETGSLPDLAVGLRNYVYMGRSSVTASDAYYQGKYDEPEISRVWRSADWVKLAYETQKANVTALSVGAPVGVLPETPPSLSPNALRIQMGGSSVMLRLPALSAESEVAILDLRGRVVWRTAVPAGTTSLAWETSDRATPAGIYLANLATEVGGKRQIVARTKIVLPR